jgi:hypothetical protein
MLQRRPGESFIALLKHLDAAVVKTEIGSVASFCWCGRFRSTGKNHGLRFMARQ